jgi:hypothetical protein
VIPEESQTLQGDLTARRLKKESQSQNPCPDSVLGSVKFPMSMGFSDLDKSPANLKTQYAIPL